MTRQECLETTNAEGKNNWLAGACPLPGEPLHAIMSNFAEFRENSLDPELMDVFFNQGANPDLANLDATEALSLSVSSPFSLSIELQKMERNPFGYEFVFPEDVGLYVYAEAVDGEPAEGMISVEKVPGENLIVATLDHDPRPDGSRDFSFQLNVEHPDFVPLRTTFVFRHDRDYSHTLNFSSRPVNMVGRLDPEYMSYLNGWISDFWAAYDSGDSSLIPALVKPASNADTEFYPFSHALWSILQESLEPQSVAVEGGGVGLIEPWNFLGVEEEVFDCIRKKMYHTGEDKPRGAKELLAGTREKEGGFVCSSFAIAQARFLEDQLDSACPGSKVYVQLIHTTQGPHAIVRVDLPGTSDCCTGTIYQENGGGASSGLDEYCKNTKWCTDNPDGGYFPVDEIPLRGDGWFFPNPDWENDESSMNTINSAICSCLTGEYRQGSMENALQTRCNDGSLNQWFIDSFSWDGGEQEEPVLDMPQILSCDKSRCTTSGCVDDPDFGVEPYVCETQCEILWSCSSNGVCQPFATLGGSAGKYETEEECNSWCGVSGAWCEIDPSTSFKTGQCGSGTKDQWKEGNEFGAVQNFQEGKSCVDLDCDKDGVCIKTWLAKYDCASSSWKIINQNPIVYCDAAGNVNENGWTKSEGDTDDCYYEYNTLTDSKCSNDAECSASGSEMPPPLPSGTPEGCCSSSPSSSSYESSSSSYESSSSSYEPSSSSYEPSSSSYEPSSSSYEPSSSSSNSSSSGGCEASGCELADGDEYAFSGEQALCTALCERFSACYALNWPDNDPNAYHDDNFGNTVSNLNGGGFADTFNIEDVTSEQFSSRLNARNGCLLCEHAFWALEPAETCSESEEYNRGFRWGVSVIGADGTAKWITSEIFDGAASLVGNYLQVFPDLGEVGFDCPGVPSLDCPP